MRQAILKIVLLLFGLTATCSQPPKQVQRTESKVRIQKIEKKEIKEAIVDPNEEMISEIIEVWELFFKDANVGRKDPRRKRFHEFASYLAQAIRIYQNQEITINGRKARLPKDKNIHILLAVLITKESSVKYDVVGTSPRFEVGLMQVWGVALNGYDKETVKQNPELGILLGVRWIAYMTSLCKPYRVGQDKEEWRTTDWLGPLTMYGAKPSKVWIDKKKKTCRIFPFARKRIKLTLFYRKRIKNNS